MSILSLRSLHLFLSVSTLTALIPLSAHAQTSRSTFTFGTPTTPDGKTLTVDSRGFLLDGIYTLPVMGEMHYSRIPSSEWTREIRKMKAGGITIIATYIFWNHHQPTKERWDWTGNNDLRAFLQACQQEQMPVVLRLGPFCHGEVYLGGIPLWMAEKAQQDPKQYKLRSLAPGFIDATTTLYREISLQTQGLLWKNGGPVIGVQIENECRGPWAYLMKLREIAIDSGFDVPFMTRTGWPKLSDQEEPGKLLPLYGDYADGFWDRKLTDMPGDYPSAFTMKNARLSTVIATETFTTEQLKEDNQTAPTSYPYLTCELGGGMMPSYHRRINISGREAFPLAICKLGSGSNLPGYYMYHGGTNPQHPDHTMAECQASLATNYNDMPHITYDFQSPLGEMGQPNWTAFHQTRWLHQFLADWGEELAHMDVDTLSPHYARRGCFIFRNDYVRILNEKGTANVTIDGLLWEGLSVSTSTLQLFAKTAEGLYLIPAGSPVPHLSDDTPFSYTTPSATEEMPDTYTISVNGTQYTLSPDKPTKIEGSTFTVLSPSRAASAYVIDGQMHFARHGGILYKTKDSITEEYWQYTKQRINSTLLTPASSPRTVSLGQQKVAEQPSDSDFNKAAIYSLTLKSLSKTSASDLFVEISYRGDCARLYADGRLVQDNFWNGKPMLTRMRDLLTPDGKTPRKIELRILPLSKDAPIYLQKEQKAELDNATPYLLSLDGIRVIQRKTTTSNKTSK